MHFSRRICYRRVALAHGAILMVLPANPIRSATLVASSVEDMMAFRFMPLLEYIRGILRLVSLGSFRDTHRPPTNLSFDIVYPLLTAHSVIIS